MPLPPLLEERSPALEAVLVVVGPIVSGALGGLLLGSSKIGYLILTLVAALGGLAAGLEHRTPLEALYRGLLGGLLFGTSLLVVFELREKAAKVKIPQHDILLVVITAIAGLVLGALGGLLRRRATR